MNNKTIAKGGSLTPIFFEAEVLPGLIEIAQTELADRFKKSIIFFEGNRSDQIIFQLDNGFGSLVKLKTVVSVFRLQHFSISSPRELLSDRPLRKLIQQIDFSQRACSNYSWKSFRISAAGKTSDVMKNIIDKIHSISGLQYDCDNGEMVIKVRPSSSALGGWEVLTRLTPRPLATRKWRVCNTPGALNGTIAAAMLRLLAPERNDSLLNLMCGSGSLMIEAVNNHKLELVVGCDTNKEMLEKAKVNIETANLNGKIMLLQSDISALPFANRTFELVCADPPWGERIGQRKDNEVLYENLLTAIELYTTHAGRAVLITQDISSLMKAFEKIKSNWIITNQLKVFQGGFHPTITVLQRQVFK